MWTAHILIMWSDTHHGVRHSPCGNHRVRNHLGGCRGVQGRAVLSAVHVHVCYLGASVVCMGAEAHERWAINSSEGHLTGLRSRIRCDSGTCCYRLWSWNMMVGMAITRYHAGLKIG